MYARTHAAPLQPQTLPDHQTILRHLICNSDFSFSDLFTFHTTRCEILYRALDSRRIAILIYRKELKNKKILEMRGKA